jgi:hypothetical protein
MAKPNSSLGHCYRAAFAAVAWMILIVAPFIAPAKFVRNPNSFYILISGMLLTVSFSIFVFVLWLTDKRRAK